MHTGEPGGRVRGVAFAGMNLGQEQVAYISLESLATRRKTDTKPGAWEPAFISLAPEDCHLAAERCLALWKHGEADRTSCVVSPECALTEDDASPVRADNLSPASAPLLSCSVPEIVRHAEKGELKAVRCLLDEGVDPNSKDDFGLTALHGAAKKGHSEVVKMLLQQRAQVNVQAGALQDETPLHYACKYGRASVVQILLASRANPQAVTTQGRTPLQYAQEKKQTATATILVELDTAGKNIAAAVAEFLSKEDGSMFREATPGGLC